MAENCIRHHLTINLNNTPGCILDKINTHSLQGFSFFIKRYYLNELTYEAILESVMYVENEHITITEKLPLVDDRWYCSNLDYMLILHWYM